MDSFLVSERDSRNLDSERIFFDDLSEDAQQKALEFKGVKSHRELNWDIFPMYQHYEKVSNLSQTEIDDNALGNIGFYH